jgi:exodeoxyribonuclease V alpha subunit
MTADRSKGQYPDTAHNSQQLISAVITQIRYRNSENGFAVLESEIDSTKEIIVVVGVTEPSLRKGSYFSARGTWQSHPRFGKQFKAFSITERDPTSDDGIFRYLSDGNLKGIGPVLAKRIVDTFNDSTISILDNEPERLKQVSGVGAVKYDEIISSWKERRKNREIYLFFHTYDIPIHLAERIIRRHGPRSLEILQEDPFSVADSVSGIGFLTADKIALKLGLSRTSAQRLRAGLLYTIERGADDGHCFLLKSELLERSAKILSIDSFDLLEEELQWMTREQLIINEDARFYLPDYLNAELAIAQNVYSRTQAKSTQPKIDSEAISRICSQSEISAILGETKVINLSEEQRLAVELAARSRFLLITGGPGCGKTTIVKTITKIFHHAGWNVKLTAPTGRAAQRLAEVCQSDASTIHRLLKFDPSSPKSATNKSGMKSDRFFHNRDNQLECDAIIIDESSMIDIALARALLEAIPQHAHVIFVGDADQLPSVGPGLFFGDLLAVKSIPRVRLNQVFRRESGSDITTIAHEINSGSVPSIPTLKATSNNNGEVFFVQINNAEEGANKIQQLFSSYIPTNFSISTRDITVLTPMNQGELGVIRLNEKLQQAFDNSDTMSAGRASLKFGNTEFKLGDRVCQRVNNYSLSEGGVFNGDQGEIIGVDSLNRRLFVRFWDGREVEYTPEIMSQLDLAYALSIHRSQGSEMPAVILVVHESHLILLERQLLYTGITRAKRILVLVGTQKALKIASFRTRSQKRNTSLSEKIHFLCSQNTKTALD